MKISKLKIQNFEGISSTDLSFDKPVTLLVGRNGQGKSSIVDAVRLAMTGATARDVMKKADHSHLIKEGAKKAVINIELGNGDSCGIDILKTKSKGSHIADNLILPYVLDASLFACESEKGRRGVLMRATRSTASTDKVKAMLESRGCDMAKAEEVLPLLRSGFPEAENRCRENARDAKAGWKAVTGETWGYDKAEFWEADSEYSAEDVATLEQQDTTAQERLNKLNREFGAMQGAKQRQANQDENANEWTELAGQVDRRQKALDAAQEILTREEAACRELAEQAGEKPAETLACPCCGVALILKDGALTEYTAPKHDPTAALQLKKHSEALVSCRNAVANRKKELQAALSAKENLENLEKIEFDQKEMDQLEGDIKTAQKARNELSAEIQTAKASMGATAKATAQHRAVSAWLELADAFGSEGIPAEIVAGALSPVNDRLAQTAADSGWMVPRVDAGMNITADGRRYGSLSESEKWRCDALLAESISFVSGTKLLVLDGFDVIEPSDRPSLISWLEILGAEKEADTVICCGTLKSCPSSSEVITAHWVEGGVIVEPAKAEAA